MQWTLHLPHLSPPTRPVAAPYAPPPTPTAVRAAVLSVLSFCEIMGRGSSVRSCARAAVQNGVDR